jgi:superfamily II DNA or RNA helicase
MKYEAFLERKKQVGCDHGFDPTFMPDMLFPFQRALVEWAVRKGRGMLACDCGLGKTPMQLVYAQNIVERENKRVLILAPLSVAPQTVREGIKFGVEVTHRREGIKPTDKIVVTNYERLHHFNRDDFGAVICDESSILKNFDGATRSAVTEFMRKTPYRLLCTATAAPNDYVELGTSSEALGELGATDMVSRFFKKSQQTCTARQEHMAGFYRFRGHAENDFWRWVCSWARAMRKPSDLGFDDGAFKLPAISVRKHTVKASAPLDGYLFDLPAVGLQEQRSDLRRTMAERCEMAAQLINSHDRQAVAWCNLNEEGHALTKQIRGAVEVQGSDSEDAKEEALVAFAEGKVRVLVTKSSICGFGLNWQNCAHTTMFPSHSYEQYYQSIRRFWRFGQVNPVTVDMITTDGQDNVLDNLNRKSAAADKMFDQLVGMMWRELKLETKNEYTKKEQVPSWL